MYPKYKCFGCGEIFRCREVSAVCPICKGRGVKIGEVSEVSEDWDRIIAKCERFIEGVKRT
ncbi:hypothetical protein ES695_00290 [Candidatus Atribacteria bacterium 1244-E10-H5-B2]|nr:MAG: hypothetical protein ES695_00290 [Candidatus Atribacteria bacterium 1244-E10-H5-B2]